MNPVSDQLGRSLTDLRVSVTDRCNFRCRYCMPREHFDQEHRYLPRADILSFEEIARITASLAPLGLRKVRLTGGEPLLRSELHKLVALLVRQQPELELALTTNGSLLAKHAQALRDAGLTRITVSLDSLSPEVFARMTDSEFPVTDVLTGIEAAHRAGFGAIKVNAVVRRGVNDHTIVELARHFKGSGDIVRFIEYMDVGLTNGWRLDHVLSGSEIVARIGAELPLEPVRANYEGEVAKRYRYLDGSGDIVRFIEYMDVGLTNGWRMDHVLSGREIVARIGAELPLEAASANYTGEVAKRYRYLDGSGEIGIITSVTQPFCGDCGRLRLSADGQIFGCLFARVGTDLRALLRSSPDDAGLAEKLEGFWRARADRYSELRSAGTRGLPRLEMSYLGG